MSQLKVNTIRHTGASSDAVTLASDGTCTVKATNKSHKNIIINGACAVAQRSTAAVTDDNIRTVDRFYLNYGGTDNHPTQERHALTSSDTGPWAKGFRYSYHVTNGDQTSGAGAGDDMKIQYNIEAQDIAQSGWDYTSASSYITFSFWVKSSVAQNFYGYIQTHDGSGQRYPFETGSLSANTWAKITKTIPGNSNITMDNDNGKGLSINLTQFMGTDLTGSTSLNTWAAWNTALRSPDQTSDWWTTNDATWEITGLQLEVGDVATDFEHRSYTDELLRCQRYFNLIADGSLGTGKSVSDGFWWSNNEFDFMYTFPVEMRTTPTIYQATGTSYFTVQGGGVGPDLDGAWTLQYSSKMGTSHYTGKTGGGTAGNSGHLTVNNAAARLGYQAEL